MKSGFPTIRVSELVASGEAELKTGPFGTQLKANEYVEHGTPVINVRNIGFGTIKPDKLEYISPETRDRLSSQVLRCEDIVFGRKGAVERHVFIRKEQHGWFQGSDCLRLRLNSPRIHPQFASYHFLSEDHQQWMKNQCGHAATMASLNQQILERIDLPIPPLPVQRRIAGILSAYDELIENSQRRIRLLEDMARALYREWFVHFRFPGHESVPRLPSALGDIPQGWEVKRLGDLTAYLNRGLSPSYDDNADTLVINQKCIRDQRLSLEPARRQSKPVPPDKLVRYGDVLINSTGVGTLGRVAQVYQNIGECSVDTHVTIARPRQGIDADFFGCALLSNQETFERLGIGATGQTELGRPAISNVDLVVPPDSLQARFGAIVRPMRTATIHLANKIQTLRRTRDLLLPRLLSGQVTLRVAEQEALSP
jgi:type I restriction enzyme S subunit